MTTASRKSRPVALYPVPGIRDAELPRPAVSSGSGLAAPAAPVPPVVAAENAASRPPAADAPRWRRHLPALAFAGASVAAIVAGLAGNTERYLTAKSGLGYALGIIGGSLMLALLLYSVRKRLPGLRRVGSTTAWFKAHMVMGVLGPVLILYHSNFRLGATNSNVALFCMLAVAGSGLVGRYIYSRIHFGLYGRQATLAELQGDAQRLRTQVSKLQLVPNLIAQLEAAERAVLSTARLPLVRPAVVMLRAWLWRRRLARYLHQELKRATPASQALRDHGGRFETVVNRYVRERLEATRRVAEFENYERLFALWHVLHLPLFVMMIIAGIVHVVAVHVY